MKRLHYRVLLKGKYLYSTRKRFRNNKEANNWLKEKYGIKSVFTLRYANYTHFETDEKIKLERN